MIISAIVFTNWNDLSDLMRSKYIEKFKLKRRINTINKKWKFDDHSSNRWENVFRFSKAKSRKFWII